MTKSLALVSILAVVWAAPAQAAGKKLFIFAGQSNMIGGGTDRNTLTANELAQNPNVQVYIAALNHAPPRPFSNAQYWLPPTGFLTNYTPWSFTPGDAYNAMNPGHWNCIGNSYGPEFTACRDIAAALGEKVFMAKYALGGSGLDSSWTSANGSWYPTKSDPGSPAEYTLSLYHSMTNWANKALAAARVTDPTTEIAGFFWMQGEADATSSGTASRYQANLTTLLSRLRSDFGKPGITMVIGRIYLYSQFSYCAIVRAAEVNVVNADSNAAWVNTDDFTLASDGVHFSDASVKTLGSRFAQAWLNLNPVPPTITCPANVTANTDAGHCYATGVTLGTPTTTGSGVSVWNNAAAQYPKGVTTVTWWAQDSKGNQATCTQTVTVNDTEPPGGAVPPNVTVSTDPDQCYATGVALGTPTVSDNCESVTVWNNAPTVYPKGVTTVTWWAQDTSGNTISGPQTVTVNDTTPPTITCPADVTVSANAGGTATNVALGSPVTGDNCSVASVGNNAPSAYPLGATVVTWTVTDGSGNTATGVQSVTVVPSSSPPGNLAISADGGRVTITWDGGVLQQADDVLGVYTDVPEAASPYTIAVSGVQTFYRARSTVP